MAEKKAAGGAGRVGRGRHHRRDLLGGQGVRVAGDAGPLAGKVLHEQPQLIAERPVQPDLAVCAPAPARPAARARRGRRRRQRRDRGPQQRRAARCLQIGEQVTGLLGSLVAEVGDPLVARRLGAQDLVGVLYPAAGEAQRQLARRETWRSVRCRRRTADFPAARTSAPPARRGTPRARAARRAPAGPASSCPARDSTRSSRPWCSISLSHQRITSPSSGASTASPLRSKASARGSCSPSTTGSPRPRQNALPTSHCSSTPLPAGRAGSPRGARAPGRPCTRSARARAALSSRDRARRLSASQRRPPVPGPAAESPTRSSRVAIRVAKAHEDEQPWIGRGELRDACAAAPRRRCRRAGLAPSRAPAASRPSSCPTRSSQRAADAQELDVGLDRLEAPTSARKRARFASRSSHA